MKKLLVIGLIGAVALFAIGRKTNVFSYASTLVTQVETDAKKQIPTKFELERVRQEIAGLDTDISQMIRPIAEYKADVQRLHKDIAVGQQAIEERKEKYLAILKDLEANKKEFRFCGKSYSADRVRQQLQRDMDNLKLQEKNVKTQQQVLDAKQASLKATQEQLAKVVSKKREYELRLAQLEAMDQSLQVARIGSTVTIDTSRTTQIESALQNLEQRLAADEAELKMRAGEIANINLFEREPEAVDLQTIRTYLEGNEDPSKTVSNK
jgi:hypothetical protein